jgi:hypothetical protein
MQRWSGWLGAGAVTVGVSGAMLGGAGLALAETGSTTGSESGSSSSGSPSAGSAATDTTTDASPSAPDTRADKAEKASKKAERESANAAEKAEKAEQAGEDAAEQAEEAATETDAADDTEQPGAADPDVETSPEARPASRTELKTKAEQQLVHASVTEVETAAALPSKAVTDPAEPEPAPEAATAPETVTPAASSSVSSSEEPRPGDATATATLQFQQQPVPVPRQTGLAAVLTFVGNLIFGAVTLLEQIVVGPPALPPNSTVTVRTSTLNVGGTRVQANWYFPDTDAPPERLIVLQHGLLATGPMYSYTAANLAERTGAIVVTPTFVSNVLAGTGFWLGGDALYRSFANLFVGDRPDLTASAVAAGYAKRYGLDPAEATLPQKFGIAGHSLGGAFAAGVTGYLAVNGAADDLVGAIMLDGVPTGSLMPTVMRRLSDYQAETGRIVGLRHIAAPSNSWNSVGNANEWLNRTRPGTFNGVVLTGGVHMDSMQGGNRVIQFLAYLFAGFPTAANQFAVQELAASWFDEWFTGADVEDPELGTTITIPTPHGDAHGAVIGTPVESEGATTLVA